MSRIGRLPVEIPKGVKVTQSGRTLTVEGPKGKLVREFGSEVSVSINGMTASVSRASDTKPVRSAHGLYRKLLQNMVTGAATGFSKTLVINGVGYRAEVKGTSLFLNLGYSLPIEYLFDKDISIAVDGGVRITVSGADREKVGQVSAEIRKLRGPEPYKGKGIRYEDERIRRKIGKSGVK